LGSSILGAPQPQRADPPPSQRVSGGRRRFERLRLIADAAVPNTRIRDLVIEAYYAQFVPRGEGDGIDRRPGGASRYGQAFLPSARVANVGEVARLSRAEVADL
jgi:hypothetical protein